MTAKKNPSSSESPKLDRLVYRDICLLQNYSVLEIATLAASCRGMTPAERIHDAVELLALVEKWALAGKEKRIRLRYKGKSAAETNQSVADFKAIIKEFLDSLRIRSAAKRDKPTGRIELRSLVGLVYAQATGGKPDSSEAGRRFNDWVAIQAEKRGITSEEYKEQFTTGKHPYLLNDDDDALVLAMKFHSYLGEEPPQEPQAPQVTQKTVTLGPFSLTLPQTVRHGESSAAKPTKSRKPPQSRKEGNKGQFLPPKTRGADREDGKFKKKRKAP